MAATEPDPRTAEARALLAGADAGRRRDIARVLTELERGADMANLLLHSMEPHLRGPAVIGLTGPPGAGKSTLVNALLRSWRELGHRVAVIAVDPSSPISGGAILGDRIRMTQALDDDGVFVRSLSSAGHLGGLSPAAVRLIDGLDFAGFDLIVVETVGTGQSEIDVAEIADVRVVICAPGLGDDIQAMKSGLLEIADILVVNKADLPGAEQTRQQLAGALSIRADQHQQTPVLATNATNGEGIDALRDAIAEIGARMCRTALAQRRRQRARYLIAHAASSLVRSALERQENAVVDNLADRLLSGDCSSEDAARALFLTPPPDTAPPGT